jgi:hypothetical protein
LVAEEARHPLSAVEFIAEINFFAFANRSPNPFPMKESGPTLRNGLPNFLGKEEKNCLRPSRVEGYIPR